MVSFPSTRSVASAGMCAMARVSGTPRMASGTSTFARRTYSPGVGTRSVSRWTGRVTSMGPVWPGSSAVQRDTATS